MPYAATLSIRPAGRRGILAAIAAVLVGGLVGGFGVPAASAAPSAPAAPVAAAAPAAGSVPVAALTTIGTRTQVVVRGLRTRGQARWVDHVVDQYLIELDGCLADPSTSSLRGGTYRSRVNLLCAGGSGQARAAAARLVASRPWYRLTVTPVPVVAFSFVAHLESGNGAAVGAALGRLPRTDFGYAEGDDVSLTYVGQGVTQAQLDAALVAFARALHISTGQVSVTPLNWS